VFCSDRCNVDYFHDAIVNALGDAYPVVETPGPDVLRVRIALTDLVSTKPEITVAMAVIPYATAADVVMVDQIEISMARGVKAAARCN